MPHFVANCVAFAFLCIVSINLDKNLSIEDGHQSSSSQVRLYDFCSRYARVLKSLGLKRRLCSSEFRHHLIRQPFYELLWSTADLLRQPRKNDVLSSPCVS